MRARSKRNDRLAAEATSWLVRLKQTTISTAEVLEFRRWRAEPGHAEAFEKAERDWATTSRLAGAPAVQAILAKADRRDERRRRWRRPARGVVLASGLALMAVGLFAGTVGLLQHQGEVYSTAIGQQRTVILSDGSRVELDTDSQIRVRYARQDRQIDLLRGRALFDVVHVASRPLTVRAGSTVIRDLGTRFIVRDDPAHVAVTVLEGSVQVSKAGTPAPAEVIQGGQALSVAETVSAPVAANTEAAASWTTGRLVFNDLPLAAAVAELNRYNDRKLRLTASVPGDLHVSGTFTADDPDRFAAALADLYDLKADAAPNGDVLLRRAENSALTP